MAGKIRRQHLVSRSYLDTWTVDRRRVLYIDKVDHTAKLVGTRDIFVVPGFLTFQTVDGASDALEVAFGRVESRMIPIAREFIAGANEGEHHIAVKALIALHFARSYVLRQAHERIRQEVRDEMINSIEEDSELFDIFQAQHGRAPDVRELRDLVRDSAFRMEQQNLLFSEAVQRTYNRALEELQPLHLQRATVLKPHRGELLVADSPVVVNNGDQGTASNPVALNDADFLWFPLSPILGVSLTTNTQPDVVLDDKASQMLNLRVWHYASRYLVARPGSDVNRALGYRTPKIDMSQPTGNLD